MHWLCGANVDTVCRAVYSVFLLPHEGFHTKDTVLDRIAIADSTIDTTTIARLLHPIVKTRLRRVAFSCAGLILLAMLALSFDVWLSSSVMYENTPREIQAICARAEFFGHAYGVLGIGLTIYFLDRRRRVDLPQFFLGIYGSGIIVDLIKPLVPRIRPRDFDFQTTAAASFTDAFAAAGGTITERVLNSSHHSFPSAHMAIAMSMAVVLARWYPAGRWWFVVLAGLVGYNRIAGGAHFASDVFLGGAIGLSFASITLYSSNVARLLELERRLRQRSNAWLLAILSPRASAVEKNS